jgi:hypothetical protein
MELLNVQKTSLSKIAVNHYLLAKETATTMEEYQELFSQLARILFEIDGCNTKDELEEKFDDGKLNTIGSAENKLLWNEDYWLFYRIKLNMVLLDYNPDETKYTYSDVANNLDKFKFL